MVDFRYTYLVAVLTFFIPWGLLWWRRSDLRKEMLVMGLLLMVVGVFTSYFWWAVDWWHPPTVTGTRIGIEDFILGFTNGGVAAVLYEGVFGYKEYRQRGQRHVLSGLGILTMVPLLTWLLYEKFDVASAAGTAIALGIVGLMMVVLRRDLIWPAIGGGILMMLVTLPFYYLIMVISPGWVEATWAWDHLTGRKFTGIPIEDLIFYFQAGFVAAPLYDYMLGVYLRKITKRG